MLIGHCFVVMQPQNESSSWTLELSCDVCALPLHLLLLGSCQRLTDAQAGFSERWISTIMWANRGRGRRGW